MPTPLIYREKAYLLHNGGIFACYDLKSGKELNRSRIPHRSYGFSASPVATNGKIFLSGEDGLVFEMKARDEPVLIAVHEMGEPLMASPALSEGVMYLRGQSHLFAVGKRVHHCLTMLNATRVCLASLDDALQTATELRDKASASFTLNCGNSSGDYNNKCATETEPG